MENQARYDFEQKFLPGALIGVEQWRNGLLGGLLDKGGELLLSLLSHIYEK